MSTGEPEPTVESLIRDYARRTPPGDISGVAWWPDERTGIVPDLANLSTVLRGNSYAVWTRRFMDFLVQQAYRAGTMAPLSADLSIGRVEVP